MGPPQRRRLWPVVLVVGLVALLGGIAAALVIGGSDDGDPATGAGPDPVVVPATEPPTTVPPTTVAPTTTEPPLAPVDVLVRMTVARDDLLDFLNDLFGPDSASPTGCADPATLIGLEDGAGNVLASPTAFPEGDLVQGGILDDCQYEVAFPGVAGADTYVVTVSDEVEGELDRADVSRTEIEANDGVIDLNELFDINTLLSAS